MRILNRSIFLSISVSIESPSLDPQVFLSPEKLGYSGVKIL